MIDVFLTRVLNARSFLAKLWALSRPYWSAEDRQTVRLGPWSAQLKERWIARGMLAAIIGLSVFSVYVTKLLNDWNARFFNALQGKNEAAFWHELLYWIVIVAFYIVATVYRAWLLQFLTIRWRQWLSQVYFRDWLADRTYYRMELNKHGTDNPEQRIEQDCASFVTQTLSLTLNLLTQVMTIVTFVAVLWQLSGSFTVPIFGGIAVPGYMMWVAVIYALLGSALTYFIGRPLVPTYFLLERYGADFRYPQPADAVDDATCREVLEACALPQLAQRLADEANWSMLLSGGEQQRVAFARALLVRPDWLFLDEATSALDEPTETHMYRLLRERLPGVTVISITHKPAVVKLHERRLEIDTLKHVVDIGQLLLAPAQ